MAVQRIGRLPALSRKEAELKEAIKAEIRRPENAKAPKGAPKVIAEEGGGPGNYVHYYVIWDGFEGLDMEARSRIVFQALKEEAGQAEALRTTIAMGLTREEAEEMYPFLLHRYP